MAATKLGERLGLNPREQRLVQVLAAVAAALVLLGVPVGLASYVASKHSDNAELRDALDSVQASRAEARALQAKRATVEGRYAHKAPELGGFLEQLARKQKLELVDSVDRPPVPVGKKFTERATTIHLRKAGLVALSRFMESIEQSGTPVAITRLNLRRRLNEPDSYDVELGVSAYDRVAPKAGAGGGDAGTTETKK